MDVSLLVSILLGLPAAILATLRIVDWRRKRRASMTKVPAIEQENTSPAAPVDQALAPIIRQAEMAADVDRQIAEELRRYEAEERSGEPGEETLQRIG